MKKFLLLVALFLAPPLLAQTPAPAPAPAPQALFSVSTQAVAVRIGGQTVAGTDLIGAFNITNNLILQSDNILAPANNMQGYFGGVRYNFSLAKIIAKTNIPANTFQPYIHAALGVVRNVPAVGASQQHYGALAGTGFDYDPAHQGKFSFGPSVEALNAPGFGKSPWGIKISANLTFVLKGQ